MSPEFITGAEMGIALGVFSFALGYFTSRVLQFFISLTH